MWSDFYDNFDYAEFRHLIIYYYTIILKEVVEKLDSFYYNHLQESKKSK